MSHHRGYLAKIACIFLVLIPAVSFAQHSDEINITLGRASVLIGRASDGLERLTKARRAKISSKWAESMQDKAADLCELVSIKLKREGLDDKDAPLCSVE